MTRHAAVVPALALLAALCLHTPHAAAQEKNDTRAKELLALLDFFKSKGVELKPVEAKGTDIQHRFTVGPDHAKMHVVGLHYLPPLTLKEAQKKFMGYSLPSELHREWALIRLGGPGGNATPEYTAAWEKVRAAFKEYPGSGKPAGK